MFVRKGGFLGSIWYGGGLVGGIEVFGGGGGGCHSSPYSPSMGLYMVGPNPCICPWPP